MSLEQAVVQLEQTNAKLQEEVVRFRDAAMGLNAVYPTITEGRQAVADGKYFSVPGSGTYMRLYRRTGSSASLIAEYPSVAAMEAALAVASAEAEARASLQADRAEQAVVQAMTSVAGVLPTDVVWDSTSDTHSRIGMNTSGVTPVHRDMRRCTVNDDVTVNYYLDPNDSTLKADGTAADLSGADGQVMVEVPRTYVRYSEVNGQKRWQVSPDPMYGFVLHPAFKVGGTPAFDPALGFWTVTGHTHEVQHRYIGAYSASAYDTSGAAYIDGLNSDNNNGRVDTSADKLASVSGKYPMVGLTRAQFRRLAANRGEQWNQLDFWLQQLLLILFITEYAGFNGQTLVGGGNVNRSYPASSDIQSDSPHTIAGVSNSPGNGTGAAGEPDPFVSWRGIENFWGQCWQWMDGLNVNNNVPYVCGDPAQFADDTSVGYAGLPPMPADNGFIRNVMGETLTFLPNDTSGSSSVAFSDHYWQTPGWRVALVGGGASSGLAAGPFALVADLSSAFRSRARGGRLAAWGAKTAV